MSASVFTWATAVDRKASTKAAAKDLDVRIGVIMVLLLAIGSDAGVNDYLDAAVVP